MSERVESRGIEKIKRRLCKSVFCLFFLLLFACGKKPTGTISGREIRLSFDRDNYPFTAEDEEGKAVGFEIELMERIAEKEGFTLKFLSKNQSALAPSVITGTSDMAIGGLSRIKDEEKRLGYSTSYLTVKLAVLLRKGRDNPAEKSLEDFRGKTVLVKEGSAAASFLEEKREEEGYYLSVVQSNEDFFSALEEEKTDAICDLRPALLKMREGDNSLEMLSLDKEEEISFIVSRGQNREILRAFDRGFRKIKENGEFEALYRRYESYFSE